MNQTPLCSYVYKWLLMSTHNAVKCEHANSHPRVCQSASIPNKYLPSRDGCRFIKGRWLCAFLPADCVLSTWKLSENLDWYPKSLNYLRGCLLGKSVPAPLDMYPRPWGQSFLKATVPGKGQTSQFGPQPRPPSQQHSDLVTEFLLLDPIWHILCKTSVKQ